MIKTPDELLLGRREMPTAVVDLDLNEPILVNINDHAKTVSAILIIIKGLSTSFKKPETQIKQFQIATVKLCN